MGYMEWIRTWEPVRRWESRGRTGTSWQNVLRARISPTARARTVRHVAARSSRGVDRAARPPSGPQE
ncbi:MAG: hypothetical protein IH840_01880 [Candidatus Heimdallarchaeota archaeon]|nr:hypothetical protein [Candidatus Heimdallarchaeota archaeon]